MTARGALLGDAAGGSEGFLTTLGHRAIGAATIIAWVVIRNCSPA